MEKRLIIVALGLLVSLSLLWIFVIPPFQTPDEQAHLRYIQFIAENKRLPNEEDISNNEILESSETIENLIEQTQADRIFHNRTYHFDFENPEPTSIDGFNSAHIYNHPPLYYIWGAAIYLVFSTLGILKVLYLIRISNLVFVVFNFLYTYKTASFFSRNNWFKSVAAFLISFWPALMFGNAGINSDVLLFTSFFAVTYYLIKIFKSPGLRQSDLVKLSLWSAAGLLSKAQFLVFFPIVLQVVIWKLRTNISFKKIAAFAAPLILPLIYFVRNTFEFGGLFPDPSGNTGIVRDNYFRSESSCTGLSLFTYLRTLIYPRYALIFKGFVGNFGWLDTQLPKIIYILAGLVLLVGATAAVYWLAVSIKKKNFKIEHALLFAPVINLELFYIYLFLKGYVYRCYENFPTQGRYYFPMLLSFVLLLLLGFRSILPGRFRGIFYKGIIIAVLLFNSFCLAMIIERYCL
ncbi:DUF2142 domain-containing protein [Patescibacteria group bacterium]|nr:DUF2142 domain-containing protein [Patescibacteria group bacterium]